MIAKLLVATIVLVLVSGCGSDPAAFSSDKPSVIMDTISTAVVKTGAGLSTGSRQYRLPLVGVSARPTSSDCDENGTPDGINQSNNNYPGYFTYCNLTVENGGDTVPGGFNTVKMVSCALEEATGGITFDGVERTVTVSGSSSCFEGMDDELPASFTVALTATAPFSANTNFEKGVVLAIDDLDMNFKLGANVSGTKLSFISAETGEAGETSFTAGTYDTATETVWYEGRFDRIECPTSSRCGWNRHIRMTADLTGDDLNTLSFGYSNIQAPPGQSGYAGVVITASGEFASGIKARLWQASGISAIANYQTVANWSSEVSNTACYTSGSETATTCGTGLDKFTDNAKFVMGGNETQTTDMFAAAPAAQSFTAVDLNSDTQ